MSTKKTGYVMRNFFYICIGVSFFQIGGLLIGLSIGYPFLVIVGAIMGLLVAVIRTPHDYEKRYFLQPGLCNLCWSGDHITGMPCPNDGCHCSRCNPFIGRYAPEDSPSYVRDFDQD